MLLTNSLSYLKYHLKTKMKTYPHPKTLDRNILLSLLLPISQSWCVYKDGVYIKCYLILSILLVDLIVIEIFVGHNPSFICFKVPYQMTVGVSHGFKEFHYVYMLLKMFVFLFFSLNKQSLNVQRNNIMFFSYITNFKLNLIRFLIFCF